MARQYPYTASVSLLHRHLVFGAFQMADSHGFPISDAMAWAAKNKATISIPHYFASAMEHGWDDIQTLGKIREAMADSGGLDNFEQVKLGCIAMFMDVAHDMPGKNAMEIGTAMREKLENETVVIGNLSWNKTETLHDNH